MQLKKTVLDLLNQQLEYEGYASSFYLGLAFWCDDQALEGCKSFFLRQSEEERMHMLKIYEYIAESNEYPLTPAIPQPPREFESIQKVFEQVLEQERKVTAAIYRIVDACYKESDYMTLKFMEWYVEEQREEEATIITIIDRIKVIGKGGQSLYYIDKEVDKFNQLAIAGAANDTNA
jgi:ferritin